MVEVAQYAGVKPEQVLVSVSMNEGIELLIRAFANQVRPAPLLPANVRHAASAAQGIGVDFAI